MSNANRSSAEKTPPKSTILKIISFENPCAVKDAANSSATKFSAGNAVFRTIKNLATPKVEEKNPGASKMSQKIAENNNSVGLEKELARMEEEFRAVEEELSKTPRFKRLKIRQQFPSKKVHTELIDNSEFSDQDDFEEGEKLTFLGDDVIDSSYGRNRVKTLEDVTCRECGEIFKTKSGLTRHMSTKHKRTLDAVAKKKRCGRRQVAPPSTSSKSTVVEEEVKKFDCSNADDDSGKLSIVDNNEDSTDSADKKNQKSFTCPICDSNFQCKMDLKNHLEQIHDGIAVLKCDVCERYFKSDELLERHRRIHTDQRPYRCEYCGKRFPWPEHLKAHIRVHFPVKEYACTVCRTIFTSSSALKKHERMHEKNFRYICEHCGEGFHVSEPYKIHLRKHVGVKPFHCGQCQKQFYSRAACRRHTMTHVDYRPWKCPVCTKVFREKQTMERHTQVHTGRKPFQCPHCRLGLATKHNMTQHVKKIHPDRDQITR